jgi:hypothetical protein
MPPPPPGRVHASCRNSVPSISVIALQIESCALRITLSKRALVLRGARQGRAAGVQGGGRAGGQGGGGGAAGRWCWPRWCCGVGEQAAAGQAAARRVLTSWRCPGRASAASRARPPRSSRPRCPASKGRVRSSVRLRLPREVARPASRWPQLMPRDVYTSTSCCPGRRCSAIAASRESRARTRCTVATLTCLGAERLNVAPFDRCCRPKLLPVPHESAMLEKRCARCDARAGGQVGRQEPRVWGSPSSRSRGGVF